MSFDATFLKFVKETSDLHFFLLQLLIQRYSFIQTRRNHFDNQLLHPVKQGLENLPSRTSALHVLNVPETS